MAKETDQGVTVTLYIVTNMFNCHDTIPFMIVLVCLFEIQTLDGQKKELSLPEGANIKKL